MANNGKNKIMRFARIFVDGYDISGDARNFDSLGVSYAEVDMTSWSDTIRQFRSDKRIDAGINGFQAFINDTAGSGAYSRLNNPGAGQEVSILFGGNAEPEAGDPAYFLAANQMASNIAWDAQAGLINAGWRIDSSVDYADMPLGVVLSGNTAITATGNRSSYDEGGITYTGWHAVLHNLSASAATWTFKVRHSTNDSTYTDLGTFTLDGMTIGSEHIGGASGATINRYVRFEYTRGAGAGTAYPVCTFARN